MHSILEIVMTFSEKLRGANISFPTKVQELLEEAAGRIEALESDLEVMANYEAENAYVWKLLNQILVHVPATHEDYHTVRAIIAGEEE